MLVYIISAHGESDYKNKTAIPANTSVQFYQPFGQEMPMSVGFKLQTALTHPDRQQSKTVLQRYKSRSLWNGNKQGREQEPEINLSPDHVEFKTGIVRADPDYKVIYSIDAKTTLSEMLKIIRSDADNYKNSAEEVYVHCLFCI